MTRTVLHSQALAERRDHDPRDPNPGCVGELVWANSGFWGDCSWEVYVCSACGARIALCGGRANHWWNYVLGDEASERLGVAQAPAAPAKRDLPPLSVLDWYAVQAGGAGSLDDATLDHAAAVYATREPLGLDEDIHRTALADELAQRRRARRLVAEGRAA